MGKESAVPCKPLSNNLTVGVPRVDEMASALAQRHVLPPSAALEELLDHLVGLSCRDQGQSGFDPLAMGERRRQGFALARAMQKEAAAMLASLEKLHANWRAFDEQVQFAPALLETIFDLDTGGPENVFIPPSVSVLATLFRTEFDDEVAKSDEANALSSGLAELTAADAAPTGFWEAVDRRLQAVIDLPIKSRLPPGPVSNLVVRDALVACRSFWTGAGWKWSMSSLKVSAARRENVRDYLKGKCEKFVADALATAGIRFDLAELHSAWETIDSAARQGAERQSQPLK